MKPPSNWISIIISALALAATTTSSYYAYSSYKLNQETQKSAIFAQFQQQYTTIEGRFPSELLYPDFRPVRGSDEYRRLLNYWIFCYAEWYETQKSGVASYNSLWNDYYAGLILHALDIASLQFVLVDMFESYGTDSKDMLEFYNALRKLAANNGKLLMPAEQAARHATNETRQPDLPQ